MLYSLRRPASAAAAALLGLATLAYPFIAYLGLRIAPPAAVGLGLLGLLGWRAWAARGGRAVIGLWPMLFAGLGLALLLALDAELGVRAYPLLVSFGLAGLFGWSLLQPPSIVERLARLRDPRLDARIVAYARKVTALWFGFLLANGTVAGWTVLSASAEVWLLYNGCIAYVAMGVLFAAEFAVRCVVRRRWA